MEGGQNPVDQMTSRTIYPVTLTHRAWATFTPTIKIAPRTGAALYTWAANILEREQNQYNGRPAPETPTTLFIPTTRKVSARVQNNRESFWSFENYLTYNKQFNDHSQPDRTWPVCRGRKPTSTGSRRARKPSSPTSSQTNNLGSATNFLPSPPIESGRSRFAFNSYFGRVNYGLKDKYLLTVTGRIDGSSKFGKSTKYAFFPSAALAWRVSQEPFMQNIADHL